MFSKQVQQATNLIAESQPISISAPDVIPKPIRCLEFAPSSSSPPIPSPSSICSLSGDVEVLPSCPPSFPDDTAATTTPEQLNTSVEGKNPTASSSTANVATLVTKWTAYARYSRRGAGIKKTHVYTLQYLPPFPLYEGARVRVVALTRAAFHIPGANDGDLEAYDPHVNGAVTRISAAEPGRVTIVIVNECCRNAVELVQVDAPQHPDVVDRAYLGDAYSLGPGGLSVPGAKLVEAIGGGLCGGSDCVLSAHEVADARIGQEIVDFTDEESSDEEGVKGKVQVGRGRQRGAGVRPRGNGIPRGQKRGKMAAVGWIDRDMARFYAKK